MRVGIFLALGAALSAGAQTPPAVQITVASPTGDPLGYSTVEVAGSEARFTTGDGHFIFAPAAAGSYKVRVKHLGFAALDTAIIVGSGGRSEIRLTLQPVAIHLSTVKVHDRNSCKSARTEGSDLYVALEELRKNAERDRILRNSYPFVYRLARHYNSFDHSDNNSSDLVRDDTVAFESTAMNGYRPGNIFQPSDHRGGADREVRLPSLTDLADDLFLRNHCFTYGGIERVGDHAAYRLDFTPAPNISDPDFEGSAYLDVQTYMILKVQFQITHPERARVTRLSVTTEFRELFPGLALFYTVRGVQPMGRTDLIEDQKLVDVSFLRGSPSQAPPSR